MVKISIPIQFCTPPDSTTSYNFFISRFPKYFDHIFNHLKIVLYLCNLWIKISNDFQPNQAKKDGCFKKNCKFVRWLLDTMNNVKNSNSKWLKHILLFTKTQFFFFFLDSVLLFFSHKFCSISFSTRFHIR